MLLKDDNRGATLIGVLISLIVIFISIAIGVRYKNYVQNESVKDKIEFNFYKGIDETIEEVYNYDWGREETELKAHFPKTFEVLDGDKGEDPKSENATGGIAEIEILPSSDRGDDETRVNKLELTFRYNDRINKNRNIKPIKYTLEQAESIK